MEEMQWHAAEKFLPAAPGVYACVWVECDDPKGPWQADGYYFNYWTGKKWVLGSCIKDNVKIPKPGVRSKPGTYINERRLRLVRWGFPPTKKEKG